MPQQDVEKVTLKIRLITLITIVGCTISVCLTVGIYANSIESKLTKHQDKLEEHTKDISRIDCKCTDLQKEINDIEP